MLKAKLLIAITAASLVFGPPTGFAQTQPDPHHPQQSGGEAAPPADQQTAGMSMMNMMAGMMKMMAGGQMGMGGMDAPGMGMTEHAEGRLAFLRAELQITDAQTKAWDDFATAVRDSAKRMMENRGAMMSPSTGGQLLSQLDAQEKLLEARLASVRALKTSFASLYEALSPVQKKSVDELLSTHMTLMPMGMMQGGMMQMMGGGMMQSGMMSSPQGSQ